MQQFFHTPFVFGYGCKFVIRLDIIYPINPFCLYNFLQALSPFSGFVIFVVILQKLIYASIICLPVCFDYHFVIIVSNGLSPVFIFLTKKTVSSTGGYY